MYTFFKILPQVNFVSIYTKTNFLTLFINKIIYKSIRVFLECFSHYSKYICCLFENYLRLIRTITRKQNYIIIKRMYYSSTATWILGIHRTRFVIQPTFATFLKIFFLLQSVSTKHYVTICQS